MFSLEGPCFPPREKFSSRHRAASTASSQLGSAAMLAAMLVLSSAIAPQRPPSAIAPQRPPQIVQRARCPVITMQDKKCAQTLPDMPRTPTLRLSVE